MLWSCQDPASADLCPAQPQLVFTFCYKILLYLDCYWPITPKCNSNITFKSYIESRQITPINPIPRGEGHICPPYHISAIFSGSTYPRRLQLYSKFKFCNYLTPKIGLVSEKFSYDPWEALKVGRVAHFLLRFCLEIDYNFTFIESRWSFLVEIEI